MILKNCKIVLEDKIINNGYLEIKDQKIIKISDTKISGDNEIDLKNKTVLPGFIDCHVHGGYGITFESANINKYQEFAKNVAKEGITSYLLATVAMSDENCVKLFPLFNEFLQNQQQKSAKCLGINMEGPFINEIKKGAHEVSLLRKPSIKDMEKYLKLSGNNIKVITYAPELQDGEFTKFLIKNNIIPSCGHTNLYAVDWNKHYADGIRHITHLFNAMNGVDHRNAGLVTSLLQQKGMVTELITDGIHVQKETMQLAYHALGADNLVIITDAMSAKGLPDGNYKLGNLDVVKKGMQVNLAGGAGSLAGSAATYDHNVRTFIKTIDGLDLRELIKMTSINFAKEIGIFDKTGSIAENKYADLTILDENNNIYMTIVNGEIAFEK
ncbi:N-acetylglucosamine-6-phosphate deacetylase [Spiroplasma endosymbiont of Crioceris asparagi]|uniref:N-acetylglucosamine-6-phosphate deacetylase n=1 Tax=Spiroplasma endosymbiont of Crioceris asparagi TaxID=3066286 RepID=UPI0030D304C6